MPFKSRQPNISGKLLIGPLSAYTDLEGSVPTDLTIWDWLFDSPFSPLRNHSGSSLRGYTNAMTKERISYAEVEKYTTYLSTALVKDHGLKEGDTVALFSPNTIWYPVAMLGTLRAGVPWKFCCQSGYIADIRG